MFQALEVQYAGKDVERRWLGLGPCWGWRGLWAVGSKPIDFTCGIWRVQEPLQEQGACIHNRVKDNCWKYTPLFWSTFNIQCSDPAQSLSVLLLLQWWEHTRRQLVGASDRLVDGKAPVSRNVIHNGEITWFCHFLEGATKVRHA